MKSWGQGFFKGAWNLGGSAAAPASATPASAAAVVTMTVASATAAVEGCEPFERKGCRRRPHTTAVAHHASIGSGVCVSVNDAIAYMYVAIAAAIDWLRVASVCFVGI